MPVPLFLCVLYFETVMLYFFCISLCSLCFCLRFTLSHSVIVFNFLPLMCVYMTVCLFFVCTCVGVHKIVLSPGNEFLNVYIPLYSLKFRHLWHPGYSETVMLHTLLLNFILFSMVLSLFISHSLALCTFRLICVCQSMSLFASTCTYMCFCFVCLYLPPHLGILGSVFWTGDLNAVSR